MAVNFTKYQDDITGAWRKVVDSSDTPNWALFGYESATNVIKLTSTGSQGLQELVQEFNCSLIQYAFCRVINQELGLNKLVLINWQGDSAPLSRKGLCASHVGEVTNYFKGCTQTITIRNDDEATVDHLMEQIVKTSSSRINLSKPQQHSSSFSSTHDDNNTTTTNNDSISSSSSHKKVDISSEIAANRKSFWQRQEEEEKERLAEDKKRAAEKQAQFEKERKQREEFEAKKLAETIRERDRLIEANKRAEKTGGSQPGSMISTTDATADDENCVGRRSELIRLERNQETQSLISKGLIKNKRAIFEQAQQQQQQNPQPTTLSRRSSGAIVAQRMNAFKSLDNNTSTTSSVADSTTTSNPVGKLADSFVEKVSIDGGDATEKNTTVTPIKKEIEPIVLTRAENEDVQTPNSNIVSSSVVTESNLDESSDQDVSATETSPAAEESKENGTEASDVSQDVNGNSENSFPKKSTTSESAATPDQVITNEELIMRGKNSSIEAIALFDYQAADNTEISFDPDDKIGHIQKVDPGWWHGLVMTGRFKGQVGLFPANYVQESN